MAEANDLDARAAFYMGWRAVHDRRWPDRVWGGVNPLTGQLEAVPTGLGLQVWLGLRGERHHRGRFLKVS